MLVGNLTISIFQHWSDVMWMYDAGHLSRISRYYKLTPTRFFTSAAARREKYGGGGVHKFRLARRRADFFPAAAARHASGWGRRLNSAAEGSIMCHI